MSVDDRPTPPGAEAPVPPVPPTPPHAPVPPVPPTPSAGDWGHDAPPPGAAGVGFDGAPDDPDWSTEVGRAAAEAARAAERAAEAAAEAAGDAAERFAERFEGLSDEIQRRIDEALRSLPERLAAAGLDAEEIERIRAGLSHAGERAAVRIEHKVAHVVAKARRAAERAAERASHRGEGRRWGGRMAFGHGLHGGPGPDGPFAHRGPRAAAADNGETMTVLRMLGEGKITAEEAERLLAAMGRVGQRV